MVGRDMSFQGFKDLAVFQAYDVIVGDRATDRDGGFRLFWDGLCHRRVVRSFECSMDRGDRRRQVRRRQRVFADIGYDHLGCQLYDE